MTRAISERTSCPSCGGSGMLRLGDQSFRTCLHCLGQGWLPGMEPATTTADLINPLSPACQAPAQQPVKDAASSAAR